MAGLVFVRPTTSRSGELVLCRAWVCECLGGAERKGVFRRRNCCEIYENRLIVLVLSNRNGWCRPEVGHTDVIGSGPDDKWICSTLPSSGRCGWVAPNIDVAVADAEKRAVASL